MAGHCSGVRLQKLISTHSKGVFRFGLELAEPPPPPKKIWVNLFPWFRVFAKGVGRKGLPWFVLTCSANKSEQIGRKRSKSEQIESIGVFLKTGSANRNKSEENGEIGTNWANPLLPTPNWGLRWFWKTRGTSTFSGGAKMGSKVVAKEVCIMKHVYASSVPSTSGDMLGSQKLSWHFRRSAGRGNLGWSFSCFDLILPAANVELQAPFLRMADQWVHPSSLIWELLPSVSLTLSLDIFVPSDTKLLRKIIPWELFFVILWWVSALRIFGKEGLFQGITYEIRNFSKI